MSTIKWATVEDEEEEGILHIIPVDEEGNFIMGHTIEGECHCYPDIGQDGEYLMIYHNMIH